jgi:hypothetical protein
MNTTIDKNLVIDKSFEKLSTHLDELTKQYRLLLDVVRNLLMVFD